MGAAVPPASQAPLSRLRSPLIAAMDSAVMRTHPLPTAALLLALLLAAGAVWLGASGRSPSKPAPAEFARDIQPLLATYCFECHGEARQKSGVAFHSLTDLPTARRQRELWTRVREQLQAGEMPPDSADQPTAAERQRLLQWIANDLFPLDCRNPDPGRVTIRRLNRSEYNHTLRDLLGVDLRPADDFPADDTGYGFDNIGDVLSVSALLFERYFLAAGRVLDAAIVTPETRRPPIRQFAARDLQGAGEPAAGDCCHRLISNGEAGVSFPVETPGEYLWRITAHGEQAGPEPVKMAARVDGRELGTMEVRAKEAGPETYEFKLRLERGPRRLTAAFLNDYYEAPAGNRPARDRNLILHRFELLGPLDAPPPPPPASHQRIFTCVPAPATTNDCARQILGAFARRAWRRAVTPDEVNRLAALAEAQRAGGASFEASLKTALHAVLVSPQFLFRGELQPDPDNPRVARPVDEFALATRLSYFLWSSTPDDELLALAERGQLRRNQDAQVRRLLRDPRSQALVENFAGQWLQLRNLELAAPDRATFPQFDDALRTAMRRETELLFTHILREDRSVLEFLTADYTFANARLARHYGLAGVSGDDFQRVSLKGTRRAGVLTHASILTLTSNPNRTSPVKRGKWVLENLLAAPPPPPPPDVPPLPENTPASTAVSVRDRMKEHLANPGCASCHVRMDPIGLAFEHFDGIGAWRDRDSGQPVDAAAELPTGEQLDGVDGLRAFLVKRQQDQFVRCLGDRMLTYALGRGLEWYDDCALDAITKGTRRNGDKFTALVLEIVRSAPFQMRRGEGEKVAAAAQAK